MSEVSLQVSKELIAPLIEQKIAAAIATELGDPAAIIESLVRRTINQKVDSNGDPKGYNANTPYLSYLASVHIQAIVKRGMEAWIKANSEKLEALVVKELNRNAKGFAKSLVDALAANQVRDIKLSVEAKAVVNPSDKDYR